MKPLVIIFLDGKKIVEYYGDNNALNFGDDTSILTCIENSFAQHILYKGKRIPASIKRHNAEGTSYIFCYTQPEEET
jgi:hypothetical protein